jgi:MFS transporter, ACS family, tartrate transporter
MILSESAAAAMFGLINSIGQLGGFAGPYVIGFLKDRTTRLPPASDL